MALESAITDLMLPRRGRIRKAAVSGSGLRRRGGLRRCTGLRRCSRPGGWRLEFLVRGFAFGVCGDVAGKVTEEEFACKIADGLTAEV